MSNKDLKNSRTEGRRNGRLLKAGVTGLILYPSLLFVYAGFGFYFPVEHYVFFLWLFLMFYLPITDRVTIITGLVFLGLCPLVLAFANDELTNRLARFAFIFLSLGGLYIITRTYLWRNTGKEDHCDD